jgi:hypothetical protein
VDARLGDRALITDLVVAYAYAVDECDWTTFESFLVARSFGG